jgi:pilus assembly protein CpaF
VLLVAQRLMHRGGRTLDPSAPVQEAQLPGGGLLQLLLPPLSPKGPLISVRCPPRGQTSADGMITDGMLTSDMLALLRSAVQLRQNVLVIGPQGGGVSTLLGVLAALAPDHERVVMIEDLPSLSLLHAQALPLSRRAVPGLPLATLLKHASRLRHDRLVIDDVTAPDALAALTAAASANGVLLGMHAPEPGAALTQLELFAQLGLGATQPGQTSLADLLARAVQLVVHVGPGKDGTRRIQSLSEVRPGTGEKRDTLELRTLYRHDGGAFKAGEQRASFLP